MVWDKEEVHYVLFALWAADAQLNIVETLLPDKMGLIFGGPDDYNSASFLNDHT